MEIQPIKRLKLKREAMLELHKSELQKHTVSSVFFSLQLYKYNCYVYNYTVVQFTLSLLCILHNHQLDHHLSSPSLLLIFKTV